MPSQQKHFSKLRLPVTLHDGFIRLSGGALLPEIKDGATAELFLDPWLIVDETERRRLMNEKTVPLLPAGTTLWARVKPDKISDQLKAFWRHFRQRKLMPYQFVAIGLGAELRLIIAEGNRSALDECPCSIPALPEQQCGSVNEAYTRISEAFEPSRRSHTGNVFGCVFVDQALGHPAPLQVLREAAIRKSQPK